MGILVIVVVLFAVIALIVAAYWSGRNTKFFCERCGSEVDGPRGMTFELFRMFGLGDPEPLPERVTCTACGDEGCWRCCHPHGEEEVRMPVFAPDREGNPRVQDWTTLRKASDWRHHSCCSCAGLSEPTGPSEQVVCLLERANDRLTLFGISRRTIAFWVALGLAAAMSVGIVFAGHSEGEAWSGGIAAGIFFFI